MKHFIIYDSTGRILRMGTCPAAMVTIQAQPGEYVMEGAATFADSIGVVNGVPVVIRAA